MEATEQKIRIAIVGGGLAGATVANALYQHPHLDIHVYEAAPKFSERGAAVGLATNALVALDLVIPSAREVVMDKAGAVPMHDNPMLFGSGPHAGKLISDIRSPEEGRVVHRAALLSALLEPLPQDRLHANKKLQSIEPAGTGSELTFVDGAKERFDAVIGADGIFGSVRKHVLQDAAALHEATPAGFWDCRYLVPFETAKARLGAQYFEKPCQYAWCGDGGFIMHDVLDDGKTVQCVLAAVEREQPKDRSRPLTRDIFYETFSNWLDGPIAKNMIDLVLECEDLKMYSQWEHKTTPTYANGSVCIMGDAAHATTPWQGSGVALAIEDAVILGTLLGNIKTPDEVTSAFRAYDEARRPRGQRVIDSSKVTGSFMCCQGEAADLEPASFGALFTHRWDFIMQFDIRQEMKDVVVRAKEIQSQMPK